MDRFTGREPAERSVRVMNLADETKLTISSDGSCKDALCRQIRTLIDMLTPLASSYRLEVGSADELNKIALVKRHEVEDAIDRANKLGHVIDYIQSDIRKLVRLYSKQIDAFAESEAARMFGEDTELFTKLLNECRNEDEEK